MLDEIKRTCPIDRWEESTFLVVVPVVNGTNSGIAFPFVLGEIVPVTPELIMEDFSQLIKGDVEEDYGEWLGEGAAIATGINNSIELAREAVQKARSKAKLLIGLIEEEEYQPATNALADLILILDAYGESAEEVWGEWCNLVLTYLRNKADLEYGGDDWNPA